MPAVPISGSPNITSLDSRIYANLCTGYFIIDISPSVFLPGGTSTSGGVQGASVKITNPIGVVFRQYPASGYDIYPPMTSSVSVAIPLVASNYQYGNYTFDVRLTDDDGTTYTVSKTVNICPPDPNNKTKKEGCMNVTIKGNCSDGKVIINLGQPPNYKNIAFTSQVNDLEVDFPAASTPVTTTYGSFSLPLYEGSWKVTGTVCVLYSAGDYIYFYVKYKVKCEKVIRCVIDECCVQAKLEELRLKVKADCTAEEKAATFSTILEALGLLKMAQLAADCGEDPSDIVGDMEKLLGCVCTCNCNDGIPIINNEPATDYVFEGCNIEQDTVGLTKVVTINNYSYELFNDDENEILSVTDIALDGCAKSQRINIDIDRIITLVNAQSGFAYRGVLSQSGTAAPTASVDSGNLVTIAWSRSSSGVYVGTLSGTYTPLTHGNTFILTAANGNFLVKCNYLSASSIQVVTADIATYIATDSLLADTPIQLSILS